MCDHSNSNVCMYYTKSVFGDPEVCSGNWFVLDNACYVFRKPPSVATSDKVEKSSPTPGSKQKKPTSVSAK